jgi:hypothetical protein
MGGGDLMQLLGGDGFDASIGGMWQQADFSLAEPMAQRFGINAEQATTVGQRYEGHWATPFVVLVTRTTNGEGVFWEWS